VTSTLLAEAPFALSFFDTATWEAAWLRVLVELPRILTSIVLVLLFWIGARIARAVVLRMGTNRRVNADAVHILADGLKWTVLTIGLITGLGTVGVDVSALIAGLGLTGLALGIALKDVVSNSIAGIMILIYKPFQRHDRITITGLEGTVVQIDLRYTTLETVEQRILIPNANLLTNSIIVRRKPPPSPIQSETD
jgi:small-conductance mechanosensitive channel